MSSISCSAFAFASSADSLARSASCWAATDALSASLLTDLHCEPGSMNKTSDHRLRSLWGQTHAAARPPSAPPPLACFFTEATSCSRNSTNSSPTSYNSCQRLLGCPVCCACRCWKSFSRSCSTGSCWTLGQPLERLVATSSPLVGHSKSASVSHAAAGEAAKAHPEQALQLRDTFRQVALQVLKQTVLNTFRSSQALVCKFEAQSHLEILKAIEVFLLPGLSLPLIAA